MGKQLEQDDAQWPGKRAATQAREERRRAADRSALWPAWVSGDGSADARTIAGNQARITTRRICRRIRQRRSDRLGPCEQAAASRSGNPRGSERTCRRGRAAQPGSGRAIAGCSGRLGTQARLQGHVGSIECNSRARAQVLRAPRLRALQNAEIIPQTAVARPFHQAISLANVSIRIESGDERQLLAKQGAACCAPTSACACANPVCTYASC